MKRISKKVLDDVQARGGEVKRRARSPAPPEKPAEKPPNPKPPETKLVPGTTDLAPVTKKLGDIATVLGKERKPWRINVNRDARGFAQSYDLIPIESSDSS